MADRKFACISSKLATHAIDLHSVPSDTPCVEWNHRQVLLNYILYTSLLPLNYKKFWVFLTWGSGVDVFIRQYIWKLNLP